jgi:hypothetical protein
VYGLAASSLTLGLVLLIATRTGFNVHPDEYWHADAFSYFETHWWPPDIGVAGIQHDQDGSSRVYYGEVVYILYGRAAAALRSTAALLGSWRVAGQSPALAEQPHAVYLPQIGAAPWGPAQLPPDRAAPLHRLLNAGLLGLTLAALFAAAPRHPWAAATGLALLALPQALYLYGYANSDAWSLSISIFLFLWALTQRRLLDSRGKLAVLGGLIGLLIVSKPSFWLILPWVAGLLLRNLLRDYPLAAWATWRGLAVRAALLVTSVAVLVLAPLRIIYPLTQPDFANRDRAMREQYAWPEFRPSNPTYPGYHLAARGVPLRDVVMSRDWYEASAKSFYGVFGSLTVALPRHWYLFAYGVGLANIAGTLYTALRRGSRVNAADRRLLLGAIGTLVMCVGASLYNSWTNGYQPQGRYLFGAFVPIAILTWGMVEHEPAWARRLRGASVVALYGLCLWILWRFVVVAL